jgi:cell wall-associated NlpC family hydrolase
MKTLFIVVLFFSGFILNSRVDTAKQLLNEQDEYDQGCSDFVSTVLKISWEDANSIMGSNPTYIGINNSYSGLNPGDVVGWKSNSGPGHVAIYIGEAGMKFIDVNTNGGTPRKVLNGYGGQSLYKSSKY